MEPTQLERLSFISYLFGVGLRQSHEPEPLCAVCVLSFHDSVELFLQLSLEKLDINKARELPFMQYFDKIDESLGNTRLAHREGIRRLDRARGNLKHGGVRPSKSDIESFRATVSAFFAENCPTIFKIEFDDISLIDLIKFERTRESLRQARSDFDRGSLYDSVKNIRISFDYLIRDYEESKKDRYRKSPFSFGEPFGSFDSFQLGVPYDHRGLKDFVDTTSKSIAAIQTAIKILGFGIDYRKYARFWSIVSSVQVSFAADGTVRSYGHGEVTLSKEELEFCTDFIVESALTLQEFDFEAGD